MSRQPLDIVESIVIDIPVKSCFSIFIKTDPTAYLFHDAIIAKIQTIKPLTDGEWNYVGARQAIHFSDGSVIEETLVRLEPNHVIEYEGCGFSQPIVSWADKAQARFEFESVGQRTRISWHYEFFLKDSPLNKLQEPVFRHAFLNLLYRRFMKKTLLNIHQIIALRNTVASNQKAA